MLKESVLTSIYLNFAFSGHIYQKYLLRYLLWFFKTTFIYRLVLENDRKRVIFVQFDRTTENVKHGKLIAVILLTIKVLSNSGKF